MKFESFKQLKDAINRRNKERKELNKNYCSDCGREISKEDCAYNVCNSCRIETTI